MSYNSPAVLSMNFLNEIEFLDFLPKEFSHIAYFSKFEIIFYLVHILR
jgi:hypothetical protein